MDAETKDKVRRLRELNRSYGQIAAEAGTSTSSVYRVLQPKAVAATQRKRRAAKQRWQDENYRGRCYCGAQTNNRECKRCQACERAQRAALHELILDVVEAMYEEGWPVREMAEAFGHETPNGVGPWLAELRRAGRVGYRNATNQREGESQ